MACAGRVLVWWDREVDGVGRRIRPDARLAAHGIWEQACQRTIASLGDHGPAAELMECAVAQVSRYLDRVGAPMASRKHGLVMVAFCRALRRHCAKLRRLELVGSSSELAKRSPAKSWEAEAHARLELENLLRRLSGRNADVLMLRAAGYEWIDIASLFGVSASALRNAFWREIDRLRWNAGRTDA